MSEFKPQSDPILSVAVRPKTEVDRENFLRVMRDLAQMDKNARITTATEDGQVIIGGMSDQHLEAICHRISHDYQIQLEVGEFRVIYLETIRRNAEAEGKIARQTGGHGNYAHVKLRLEPSERGSGYQFVNESEESAVPLEFVAPVALGIEAAVNAGILSGHRMVDLRTALCGGSHHVEDSNEMSFRFAGSIAFKEAARKALPCSSGARDVG